MKLKRIKIFKFLLSIITSIVTIVPILTFIVSCSCSSSESINSQNKLPDNPDAPQSNTDKNNSFEVLINDGKKDINVDSGQTLTIKSQIINIFANDNLNEYYYQWEYTDFKDNNFIQIPNQNSSTLLIKNIKPQEYNGKLIRLKVSSKEKKIIWSNECLITVTQNSSNIDYEYIGIEGIDYFYLPNTEHVLSNRITIPTTKNKQIIQKYGTIPLPWKDDNLINETDVINMFTFLALGKYQSSYREGIFSLRFENRNIDGDLIATTYAKWIINYLKIFPYFQFQNGSLSFEFKENKWTAGFDQNIDIYDQLINLWAKWNGSSFDEKKANQIMNQTTFYVDSLSATGFGKKPDYYFNEGLVPGKMREQFIKMLIYLFSQVRPNMTDWDKFLLAFNFTSNWIYYPSKGLYTWASNSGVCADYSNLLALCLNFLGIPALPMVTNSVIINDVSKLNQNHEIVWVYFDPNNNDPNSKGNPQWYGTDPTFFDTSSSAEGNELISKPSNGIARNQFAPFYVSRDSFWKGMPNILFNTSKSQFNVNNTDELIHFPFSSFFYMPWKSPYLNQSLGNLNLGEYNWINENGNSFLLITPDQPNKHELWNYKRKYSRFIFNNGYYYWLCSMCNHIDNTNCQDQTMLLRAKSGAKQKAIEKVDVPVDLNTLLQTNKIPLLQQWNNWIIFLDRINNEFRFFQFDEHNIDWSKTYTIKINHELINDPNKIVDFYLDLDGFIQILYLTGDIGSFNPYDHIWWNGTYSENHSIKISLKLSNEDKQIIFNPINNLANVYIEDIKNGYDYFYIISGLTTIGNDKFQVSLKTRQDYYADLKKIRDQTNIDNQKKLINMYNLYQTYVESSIPSTNNKLLQSQLTNNQYFTNIENYKQYGLNFSTIRAFSDFQEMQDGNLSLRYDIYFSQNNDIDINNEKYLILKDSYEPKITWNNLTNPFGYYKIKIFTPTNKQNYIYTNTFRVIDSTTISGYNDLWESGKQKISIGNVENYITNYNQNDDSWFSKPVTLILDWYIPYNANIKLKYINLDNPNEIKTLRSFNQSELNYNRRFEIAQINNSNHGIYYWEVSVNEQKLNMYTNIVYIATKNDIVNYDNEKWFKISQAVK